MPVPKRKRSRARRDSRFANKGINVKSFTQCSHCQSPVSPHQVCHTCGYYKGKKILKTKLDRIVKRTEQTQRKAMTAQQTAEAAEGETAE